MALPTIEATERTFLEDEGITAQDLPSESFDLAKVGALLGQTLRCGDGDPVYYGLRRVVDGDLAMLRAATCAGDFKPDGALVYEQLCMIEQRIAILGELHRRQLAAAEREVDKYKAAPREAGIVCASVIRDEIAEIRAVAGRLDINTLTSSTRERLLLAAARIEREMNGGAS